MGEENMRSTHRSTAHGRLSGTRRRAGRSRRALIVAVVLATLMSLVPAAAASAHPRDSGPATPDRDSAHPWASNGCTAVPDRITGVMNFNHACDHHDGCYGQHWSTRSGCDNRFWHDMDASCREDYRWWNPSHYACDATRNTYYLGVRTFGAPAYYNWSISSLFN